MNNLKIILKKSAKFLKLYLKDYLLLIKKPILIGFLGCLSLLLCVLGPIGAILSLFIYIPCVCYAFWQGYLMTYALNYAADSYIKIENKVALVDCYDLARKEGKQLGKFLGYSVVITLIICLPLIIFAPLLACYNLEKDIVSLLSTPELLNEYFIILSPSAFFVLPFCNFLNQAFFYRKKEESFNDLFKNCYKLNKTGVLLVVIFSLFAGLNFINSIIYSILALLLNPLIYCANTIWFKNKLED